MSIQKGWKFPTNQFLVHALNNAHHTSTPLAGLQSQEKHAVQTIILTNSFTLSEGVGLSEKCDYIISYFILSMESDECSSSVRSNWLIKASTSLTPHKQ